MLTNQSILLYYILLILSSQKSEECKENLATNMDFRFFSPKDQTWITVPYKKLGHFLEKGRAVNHFSLKRRTVFLFPEWGEWPTKNDTSSFEIASAFYNPATKKTLAVNCVLINYFAVTKSEKEDHYLGAVLNSTGIGKCVGEFLKDFVKVQPVQEIQLIGYGLGAHIMGFAGREFGRNQLRLTALDPAYLLFDYPLPHLEKEDGRFMDVIHTDFGNIGYHYSLGTVDFYPNNGLRKQPACISDKDAFCSHKLSWKYYVESIRNKKAFSAFGCEKKNVCFVLGELNTCGCVKFNSKIGHMGYWVSLNRSGDFYLNTRHTSPYNFISEATMQPRSAKALKLDSSIVHFMLFVNLLLSLQ